MNNGDLVGGFSLLLAGLNVNEKLRSQSSQRSSLLIRFPQSNWHLNHVTWTVRQTRHANNSTEGSLCFSAITQYHSQSTHCTMKMDILDEICKRKAMSRRRQMSAEQGMVNCCSILTAVHLLIGSIKTKRLTLNATQWMCAHVYIHLVWLVDWSSITLISFRESDVFQPNNGKLTHAKMLPCPTGCWHKFHILHAVAMISFRRYWLACFRAYLLESYFK